MSLLRDRLNRLTKSAADRPSAKSETRSEPGWDSLGARLQEGRQGSFILRRQSYPLSYIHGRYQLQELCDTCTYLQPLLRASIKDPRQILFLDTETTGLGVGAGNVPFMVGLGYYNENQFVVEQMLIRNPGEEVAMLTYLTGLLPNFDCLATYNGRTFDWPILKNRMILNRVPLENDRFSELDFLYPSRSLWRTTLPSCRLSKVEESRLGFIRHDDVPGSLAPTLYFQYLAEQNPAILQGVFKHNEQDILSLVGLAIHFARALCGSLDLSHMEASELFRLGVWLDQHQLAHLASQAYEQILRLPSTSGGSVRFQLSLVLKKKGRLHEAVQLWKETVDAETGMKLSADYIEACVELSKYYEHKHKDFGTALYYAEKAIGKAGERASLLRAPRRSVVSQDLRKRMERLREKEIRRAMQEWRSNSSGLI
ncbi:ribonuclease H-like domain-containing protein [Paenibacillus senegalensis]|uniref:ribonuclease H-like domain-containing protein n=1 Tax=Paenibacillus senegalensis TaxID=1465766 RepID=UPI00028A15DC|nr:ribonuclease H-like domain-containing protein [Paenibacillus senegalensis]